MKAWSQSRTLREAALAKNKPRLMVQIPVFILVYLVVQSFAGLLKNIPALAWVLTDAEVKAAFAAGNGGRWMTLASEAMTGMPSWLRWISLLSAGLQIPGAILYCRCAEGRSLGSMGLGKTGWWKEYLLGFAVGTALLLAAGGIAVGFGGLELRGNRETPWGWTLLFLLAFILQGAGEEVMLRGYFMVSLTNRASRAWAVAISAVAFAALHLGNSSMSPLAFLNLALFGVFAGVYMLRRDSLWGVCAFHSAWNWVQGSLLGVPVSGLRLDASVWEGQIDCGLALVHGGDFGLEGGLAVTAVLLIAILLTLFLPGRPTNDTI